MQSNATNKTKPYPKHYKALLSSSDAIFSNNEFEFMVNLPLFDIKNNGRWVFDLECLSIHSEEILKALNVVNTTSPINKPFGSSVVAYYDFANPTDLGRDVSGNDLHGTPLNNVAYSTDRGNSINFTNAVNATGSNLQRIDLTSHLNVFKSLTNISVSGWFKTTQGALQSIVSFSDNRNGSTEWLIFVENNKISYQVRVNGTTLFKITTLTNLNDNAWHHFVASSGSAGNYLYIDNVLITNYGISNSSNTASINNVNLTDANIGANKDDKANHEFAYNGNIADIMIFNEQIGTDMITRLYNNDYGYDVYGLLGQSNMVGRSNIVAGTDDNYTNLGRVFQFPYDVNGDASGNVTGTTITQATNPLDHISSVAGGSGGENAGQTGLWKTCFEVVQTYTRPIRRRILLVPVAKGGTSFASNNWNRGNPIYTAAKNSLNAALATHPWNTLKAILWHQGESDADAQNANYLSNITSMHEALKIDVPQFNDATPFIVGGIRGSSQGATWVNNINNALRAFATSRRNVVYLDTGDLTIFDTYHYDVASLRTMGLRYASFLLNAIGDVNYTNYSSFANLHIRQLPQIATYNSKTQGNNDVVMTFSNAHNYKDINADTVATPLSNGVNFVNTPLTFYFSNDNLDKVNVPNGNWEIVIKIWEVDDIKV